VEKSTPGDRFLPLLNSGNRTASDSGLLVEAPGKKRFLQATGSYYDLFIVAETAYLVGLRSSNC
jgi:hypothetical protein